MTPSDNQLSLDAFCQPAPTPAPVPSASGPNAFGCCSRYRACSDAKRCVIPERNYSAQCMYRKNLEAGRIFYGKNAVFFSASVYDGFLDAYRELTPDEQLEFQAIVGLFVYWRNGSQEELLFVSPGISRMGELGLLELRHDPTRILSMFSTRYLKSHFPGLELTPDVSRRKAIGQCVEQNPSAAHALTDHMVYACVPANLRTYYVEFYHDFMECEAQPPKPLLPLESEDLDLLKEFRRAPSGPR